MALNAMRQAFVEAFCGNATEAALKAGYSPKTAYSQGQRLLKSVEVKAAIATRQAPNSAARIADRQERQSFWTHVMRDPDEDMRNRLKAAELLGRSECDFVESDTPRLDAIRAGSFVLNRLTGPSQAKIGRGRAPRAARLDEIHKRMLNIYKIN